MPKLVDAPVVVPAVGEPPKIIEEFAGGPSTGDRDVSIARMRSPSGWSEPGQTYLGVSYENIYYGLYTDIGIYGHIAGDDKVDQWLISAGIGWGFGF